MADDEEVLHVGAVVQELVEVLESGVGGEGVGVEDLGFVADLGADERGGLEAALEGAGDDEIELDVEGIEDMGKLHAVALAFLVERTFGVEEGIDAPGTGTGVT
jgi:hypothetical protein